MISAIKAAWTRFRSNFWRALAFDAVAILAVFLAVHAWQTRDLPIDEPAPETRLEWLKKAGIGNAVQEGRAGSVYFFAPWCFYCRHSIGNLDDPVAEGRVSWGTVIALDYGDAGEVQAFVDETGLDLPVLMGTRETAADWSIRAFPTYYVIDAEGRISSRAVGYSTGAGMLARYWLARL